MEQDAAPAGSVVSRTLGGLGTPPYGHYDPCARRSLDASRQTFSRDSASAARGQKSAAAERRKARLPDRKGRRHASPACRGGSPPPRGLAAPASSGALLPLAYSGRDSRRGNANG